MVSNQSAMLTPVFQNIPAVLKDQPRWVCWDGDKVPYQTRTPKRKASVSKPSTWASYDPVRCAYERGGYRGVGFVLNGDGIAAVDLDKCVSDGKPAPAAMSVLAQIGCEYVELSPSGTGLRGFGYADPAKGSRGVYEGVNVELYTKERYLTVTGHVIKAGPLIRMEGFSEIAAKISQSSVSDFSAETFSGAGLGGGVESVASVASVASVSPYEYAPITLPTQAGQRNRCLFHLARLYKSKYPNASKDEQLAIVKGWHSLVLPVIKTKDFGETWADFRHAWKVVKFTDEAGARLASVIDNLPPLPHPHLAEEYGSKAQELLRLCLGLQLLDKGKEFFLGCRTAGDFLGIDRNSAAAFLRAFVADGLLRLVTKGAQGKASRYQVTFL